MASSINTIFLKENEKDIFTSLQNQGIDTKVFENKFAHLFHRIYNNYVGYYIFKQNDRLYKLIILPKTISIDCDTKEKDFVNYLLHYHRVNNKYKFDETKRIEDSLLSLAFKNNNDENNSHLPLDEFEFYKYKSILEAIEKFFKKHKNYKRIKVDYASQSVKYKLNLQRNIQELDKTKLHQTRTIDVMYSLISTITYTALKLFISNKLSDFDEKKKKELLSKCRSIHSLIAKKYNLDKSYKFTLSKLNSLKISKIFKAKNETKELLVSIKSLFGFEQMYDDNKLSVNNNYDLMTTSFFINPITFYEWYVYDILKKFTEFKKYKIQFDKDKSNNTKTKYLLDSKRKDSIQKSSNPDYILIDEQEKIKIVIDAKWKNIDKLGDISSSDYLKLKFDSDILEDKDYSTISYFIYPNLYDYNDVLNINIDKNSFFNFNVMQIDMDFEKDKNRLDFTYDYKMIEERIIESTKVEKLKTKAHFESSEIKKYRTTIVNDLLSQDNLENKEEVFNHLDNFLLKSADKLNENIEKYISDDILEILSKYDEVLEDDSKKFLKSSSSIYNYYKDKNYEEFDYSMSGIGLWKLIELELNTSFVWYIRIKNGVCDKNSSKISLLDEDIERNIIWVKLNEYDKKSGLLNTLMLGQIKFLSGNKTIKKYFQNRFISHELYSFVQNVINVRNEHAHIKAMGLDKFEELYDLLFKVSNGKSNIEILLDFKQRIKVSIDAHLSNA